jgi:hypothetical protein
MFNDVLNGENANVILPCWRSNVIVKMDMFSQKYEVIDSGLDGDISGLIVCGDSYIVAKKDGKKIYRIKDGAIEELQVEVENDGGFFLYSDGKRFCAIPKFGNRIEIFELETLDRIYEYKVCKDRASFSWLTYENMTLCNKKIDEHRVIFYEGGKILILDMEKLTTNVIKIKTTPETDFLVKEHINNYTKKNVFNESVEFGLVDFWGIVNA